MRSLKSGARKKPWRVGSSHPGKDRTHSRSRLFFFHLFLSFSHCCSSFFEDRSVRNGCCWEWLQRTRTSSCHQDVAWCWCWEYARASRNYLVPHEGPGWATCATKLGSPRTTFTWGVAELTIDGVASFWESMSRWIESVIDAAGSWTRLDICVVDRPDLYRDIGVFQHRQWNKEKTEMRKW